MIRHLFFAPLVAALAACDGGQPVHALDPDLNRMLIQPRAEAYGETPVFPDGKVMRTPPRGTVPHDRPSTERPRATPELLAEGQRRYDTVCAVCHGVDGSGHTAVAEKMKHRPPPALDDPEVLEAPDEELYRVVGEGFGFMPGYAFMLAPRERWAVVAYVKALRLRRHARVAELPAAIRRELEEAAP